MKIKGNFENKNSKIKIEPENQDDLWTLNTILEQNDIIKAETYRKINLGDKTTEKSKVIKKKVNLTIKLEKIEFKEHSIKLLGTIISGPEDIPFGSHHSFNIEANSKIEVEKDWLNYQIEKIKEATNRKECKILVCLFNREEAILGKLEHNFIKKISSIKGNVAKKGFEQKTDDFFKQISEIIEELDKQNKANNIIFGSSNFWIKPLKKEIENKEYYKKCIFTTVNSVNEAGFNELLTKKEVISSLKDISAVNDKKIVDEIFKRISNNELVSYGLKDCYEKSQIGSIKLIICTDDLIADLREKDQFKTLEEIFQNTEKSRGKIHIIGGESEAVKKLNGLGGIAATLRF